MTRNKQIQIANQYVKKIFIPINDFKKVKMPIKLIY